MRCEPPPNFHRVTPLREDGKDAMKLYTDPNYFLNLWIEGENKDYEQRKKRQRDRREKRKKREGGKAISGPTRKEHTGLDKEFREDHAKKLQQQQQQQQSAQNAPVQQEQFPADNIEVPTSQENGIPTNPSPVPKSSHSHLSPAPPPPQPPDHAPPIVPNATMDVSPQASYPAHNEPTIAGPNHRHPQRSAPLAPPPPNSHPPQPPSAVPTHPPPTAPITSSGASLYHQPPPQQPREPSPPPANIPAPPPNLPGVTDAPPSPPLPAMMDSPISVASGDMDAVRNKLRAVERTVIVDPRANLMTSILQGATLRKVEKKEEVSATQSYAGNDVAAILSRRIAIELSDSDSDYDDDYSDDEDWDA